MDDLLYHYCTTPTAHSILQSRTIRLSALSSANDSLEGRIPGQLFTEALKRTSLSDTVVDVASVLAQAFVGSTEGFAFCLSEDGDLLSQWRAYARDGTGISIGFDPKILVQNFGPVNFGGSYFELVQVSYGHANEASKAQKLADEIAATLGSHGSFVRLRHGLTVADAVAQLADRGTESPGLFLLNKEGAPIFDKLLAAVQPMHFRIYGTKPLSFREEREWRLLRYQRRAADANVEYSADDVSIRPFVSCLVADDARHAIQRVILGPKHRSHPSWVRAFLASVGLPHVQVVKSTIDSYR